MNLAHDYLREHLQGPDLTQADFAKAAGMTASNVSDLLKGDVSISDRNVGKLLRGFRTEKERHDFLVAYLRDQVPDDYSNSITILLKSELEPTGLAEAKEPSIEVQLATAFAALPSDLYRRRLIRFLNHLKKDAALRDLFVRTVAYLEESDQK